MGIYLRVNERLRESGTKGKTCVCDVAAVTLNHWKTCMRMGGFFAEGNEIVS
jgi:hypothetical protein